jgi:hypothetical protein
MIEFLSYCLCYQTVLIGPMCIYNDYIEFITGYNVDKHQVSSLLENNNDVEFKVKKNSTLRVQ